MKYLSNKLADKKNRRSIENAVFFVPFFLYLWLVVDLRFVYNAGGMIARFPVFYRGWEFFHNFAIIPGGITEYLSAFLVQFFYYSWAGAIVVTLQAWLICLFTTRFVKSINISRFHWARFIGPVLMLVLYNQYMYFFNIATGLLIALLFALFYVMIRSKNKFPCLVSFFFLSIVLYAIAAAASLSFALLCVIYELLCRRRPGLAVAQLLLAVVIAYIQGVVIYGVSIIDAFSKLLPVHPEFSYVFAINIKMIAIACAIYLFLPLTVLVLWLWQRVFPSYRPNTNDNNNLMPILLPSLYLVITVAVVFFSYSSKLKNTLEVDYYSTNRMWPQVLEVAGRDPGRPFMVYMANRALYHTDRLAYDIFSYPQNPKTPFFEIAANSKKIRGLCQKSDFCIDLGLMNQAEHFSLEFLESYGELPMLLKRLALIKMVKGNITAAKVYLGALSKTLFHDDWANDYLTKLDADPNLSADKRIQYLRSITLKNNYVLGQRGLSSALSDLLKENKYNRMAFEYQMAIYLLTKQPAKVAENIGRLDDFGYPNIPRSYKEALLLHKLQTEKNMDLQSLNVDPESYQRYMGFTKILNSYQGDSNAAYGELMKNYKSTYYFYYLYGPFGAEE